MTANTSKRKPNEAFMKPVRPSPELAAVVGEGPMPRTEIISRLWKYIKEHNLQDRREINADEKLRPFFGKDRITMFELPKLVKSHIS